ncbi:CLIP-associating protein 1-like isoform X6 [Pomacea canaliculata]|uniref:CLIP-associating protein 1-like isoform X6 n=1 Tax=Pomacea canaliculata TaxID=400727 RepID=UPI000D726DED|nr:CLIP-associating protein 1-like isoform X6 [Pomacea canaliculata]
MESLDDFLDGVLTQDVKKRFQVHQQLVSYLSDPLSSLKSDDLDRFVEGLAAWVSCSNYKVSVNGLEVLCLMVDRMGEEFKPHITTVLPAVIDRLGDAKDQVRDQAQQLLLKLMLPASSPQYVYERMAGAFGHKLWHVREGVLVCLQNTINRYGARSLQLSKTVPAICKLLDDQNGQVRDAAVNTLTEIYRHVGEKVRVDLSRKGIPQQRLAQIFARFDEVKASGNMLPTADMDPISAASREDEVDFAKPVSTKVLQSKKGSSSSGTKAKGILTASKSSTAVAHKRRRSGSASSSSAAGAVDEELFIKSFEDVPKVKIFSSRDMLDQIAKVNTVLSDPNQEWEKRIDHLKLLRALVMNGAAEHDDFHQQLRVLEPSFVLAVKDLRSQVVREACITIAYLAQQLGNKLDRCAEVVLPPLFILIPNSAKIMATSGCVCIRFIIQYVHSSRLIPIVTSNMSSKSNAIRRQACEFLNQLLHSWGTHTLEKHIAILQDAIRRGISDADSEARAFARKAFWGFAEHFKSQADALLGSLDVSKQKMLQGELSNSSSNNSLNSAEGLRPGKPRARSASQDRALPKYGGTLERTGSTRKTSAARVSSSRSDAGSDVDVEIEPPKDVNIPISPRQAVPIVRSRSDVDLSGVQPRVNTSRPRASTLLGVHKMEKGATTSLPRQKSSSLGTSKAVSNLVTPERAGRTRSRIGVSQSQQTRPGSRSTSPSSRGSYLTHTGGASRDPMTPKGKRRSGIPRSQGTSREASPNRVAYGRERRLSGSKIPGTSGGLISQRVLRPGSDVEDALHDALSRPGRKRYDMYDSDDAASETSSVCSERSYSSYSGRTSETSSDVMDGRHVKDMQEILALLGSGSYTERKDGLVSLQHLLRSGRYLSRVELKKVTEIFSRMFHDPHSKVFSIFLDTLVDLAMIHARDLTDWLYILLTRLLNKTGTDMLGSVLAKLQRTLDTIKDTFPCDHQFNTLTKFIIDQTQSPNLKQKLTKEKQFQVKIAMLNYLHSLIMCMEPSDFVNTMDTRLAISRIINWTMEPRNVDVRKSAQLVLISLFNLNPPEFSLMLAALPKAFQDGATKILHSHMRSASDATSDVLSPRNATSPPAGQQRSRPPSRQSLGQPEDFETENMNPEDIYNSIKKTSADIQNLSLGTKLDGYDDIKKKREFASQDSGIQELRNDSPDGVDARRGNLHMYNPNQYQDDHTINGFSKMSLHDDEAGVYDKRVTIPEILRELSNHNERVRERRRMLDALLKLVRDNAITTEQWDEHFKSILLILIETFGDSDKTMRMDALIVFRSILKRQPARFRDYAELTILKICEAHKDPSKDVQRAAEECALVIPTAISPEQALPILNSIIQTAKFPIHWAAIKMQVEVVKLVSPEVLTRALADTVPGLLMGYDDSDSRVRKASVFCLVNIYMAVGEGLRPYLTELNSSKTKLLNYTSKEHRKTPRVV